MRRRSASLERKEEEIETEVAATVQAALAKIGRRKRVRWRHRSQSHPPPQHGYQDTSVHQRIFLRVVHGPIQSRALASLRALAIELLAHLSASWKRERRQQGWQRLRSRAIDGRGHPVARERREAHLDFLLHHQNDGWEGRHPCRLHRIHGYLSSMLLTIVSLDHPALGNVYVARSVADATILKRRHKATVTLGGRPQEFDRTRGVVGDRGQGWCGGLVDAGVPGRMSPSASSVEHECCAISSAAVNDHQLKGEYAAQRLDCWRCGVLQRKKQP